MVRTAINLYSVRELDEPTLDILDRVADAGYDGVQFSGGLGDATPEEVADRLDEHGLDVTAPHIGIDLLEDDLATQQEIYAAGLGCDAAVVPWLPESAFETSEAVTATVERLNDLAVELAANDWDLHYHNHAHEFVETEDGVAFDRFVAETDDAVGLELDVGWALVGGIDPAAFIRDHADRVDIVHMKDMDTSVERGFREIGEGDVDMQACAEAARAADASWLVYEHDEPENPAQSIETGAAFLQDL